MWLFLSLVFQFLDKAFPDTIAACEETTPHMLVTPEIVSSLGVNHRQVCVSCGRLLVVIRDGVFGDVAVVEETPHERCPRRATSSGLAYSRSYVGLPSAPRNLSPKPTERLGQ